MEFFLCYKDLSGWKWNCFRHCKFCGRPLSYVVCVYDYWYLCVRSIRKGNSKKWKISEVLFDTIFFFCLFNSSNNDVYDAPLEPTARKNWTTLPETVTDGCTIRQMCFISPAGYFVLPSVMPDTAERTGAISVINTFHRQSLWKGWPLNQCIP